MQETLKRRTRRRRGTATMCGRRGLSLARADRPTTNTSKSPAGCAVPSASKAPGAIGPLPASAHPPRAHLALINCLSPSCQHSALWHSQSHTACLIPQSSRIRSRGPAPPHRYREPQPTTVARSFYPSIHLRDLITPANYYYC